MASQPAEMVTLKSCYQWTIAWQWMNLNIQNWKEGTLLAVKAMFKHKLCTNLDATNPEIFLTFSGVSYVKKLWKTVENKSFLLMVQNWPKMHKKSPWDFGLLIHSGWVRKLLTGVCLSSNATNRYVAFIFTCGCLFSLLTHFLAFRVRGSFSGFLCCVGACGSAEAPLNIWLASL